MLLDFSDIFESAKKEVLLETFKIEDAKRLKDAILWIRWDAMLRRQRESSKIRFIFKQFQKTKKIDWSQTIPLLEKMGYVNANRLNRKDHEKILVNALSSAANETGNELPSDVTEEDIAKNISNAKRDFFEILKSAFENDYRSIVNDPRNTSYTRDRRTGHRLFDGEDDLVNSFITRMMNFVAERPRLDGDVTSWKNPSVKHPNFGERGKVELDNNEFADRILASFRAMLYREIDKEAHHRRLANSPALRKEDAIKKRSVKRSTLKLDLEKGGKSLDFYKKYLQAMIANTEDKIKIKNKMDENRAEIMLHIRDLQSRYPDLFSLLPENLNRTLFNYYRHFLGSTNNTKPLFMGSLDSVDSDVPGGSDWQMGYPEDELIKSKFDREGLVLGKKPQEDHSERNQFLLSKLHVAMNLLMKQNPKWALALCVKFGLNCSRDSVRSVSGFSKAIIQMTADGQVKQANKLDCVSQCNAIGLTVDQTTDELSNIMGATQQSYNVRNWINFGLQFICKELSNSASELALT